MLLEDDLLKSCREDTDENYEKEEELLRAKDQFEDKMKYGRYIVQNSNK
jgi:hypothetical protein